MFFHFLLQYFFFGYLSLVRLCMRSDCCHYDLYISAPIAVELLPNVMLVVNNIKFNPYYFILKKDNNYINSKNIYF